MSKLMRITSNDDLKNIEFEDIFKRFDIHLKNEARKFYNQSMFGNSLVTESDIYQELLIELWNTYKDYDYKKAVFVTLWHVRLLAFKSHKISYFTKKKRGAYKDEHGKMQTVKQTGIEQESEEGTVMIITDELITNSNEKYIELIDMLKSIETKNDVENTIINRLISDEYVNVQEIANEHGVSRQYVNNVKNKLFTRIKNELGD